MTEVKQVVLVKEDLQIDYTIYNKSVQEIADKYQISFSDAKKALRAYDISVRKNEKETPKAKEYSVFLKNLNKTLEQVEVENKTKEAVTT